MILANIIKMSYKMALSKTTYLPGDVCSQYMFTDEEVLLDISYSGLFIAKFCNKYTEASHFYFNTCFFVFQFMNIDNIENIHIRFITSAFLSVLHNFQQYFIYTAVHVISANDRY